MKHLLATLHVQADTVRMTGKPKRTLDQGQQSESTMKPSDTARQRQARLQLQAAKRPGLNALALAVSSALACNVFAQTTAPTTSPAPRTGQQLPAENPLNAPTTPKELQAPPKQPLQPIIGMTDPTQTQNTQNRTGTTSNPVSMARNPAYASCANMFSPMVLTPDNETPPKAITVESAAVARIKLETACPVAPADGQTAVRMRITLFDASDKLINRPVTVTVETSAGQVRALQQRPADQITQRPDLDRVTPGNQLRVENGAVEFELVAPYEPQDVRIRLTAGNEQLIGELPFVPDLREMLATGLVEAIVSGSSKTNQGRIDDGLERELQNFTRSFSNGKGSVGVRSEFFLKGVVRGDYLLTMAYDSEKASRSRLFRDIRPEEFYPIYGDASLIGFDARSNSRLYVRIDKDRSFLLHGDFSTASTFEGRSLGNYQRSLTGLQGRYDSERFTVTSFAARDNTRRIVDEQPARGISGPYFVSRSDGIRGSERVEIVTRDRNQPAVILAIQQLQRNVDYNFEPFSGQVIFKSPVPTLDANFNPNTVRITYEIEQSGPSFWVYGGEAQFKLTDNLAIGASAAKDENPFDLYRLASVNAVWKLGPKTSMLFEYASTRRTKDDVTTNTVTRSSGNGTRLEFRHSAQDWNVLLSAGRTDPGFDNPAAQLNQGRAEALAQGELRLTTSLSLRGELRHSEDTKTGAQRDSGEVAVTYRATPALTLEGAVRQSRDKAGTNNTAVNASASGINNIPVGPGYSVFQTESTNLVAAPTLTDSTTVRLRAAYKLDAKSNLLAEYERDISDAQRNRVAIGADYQIYERTRLYGRIERLTSTSGPNGLNNQARDTQLAIGVDSSYSQNGQVFSEYRLRDSMSGRDAQAALGLRHTWKIAEGVAVQGTFERQQTLAGTTANSNGISNNSATSIGFGAELTYSQDWKASGRLELRRDSQYNSWLSTLAYTTRLNDDYSWIARNYFNYADYRGGQGLVAGNTPGDKLQNRLQLGVAYRPIDDASWMALGRYELKLERDLTVGQELRRAAHVLSLHSNYHPSRPWWVSNRVALKRTTEDYLGTTTNYTAVLFGGRVIYDINERWDIGVGTSVLYSPTDRAAQYVLGAEVGYLVMPNLWLSGGYNWRGFYDRDLTGLDYTRPGWYLRLRYKFDEDLFNAKNPEVNRTLPRVNVVPADQPKSSQPSGSGKAGGQ